MRGFSIAFFASDRFTHFNLPFEGQRGSIALSTEKWALRWTSVKNYWRKDLYNGVN